MAISNLEKRFWQNETRIRKLNSHGLWWENSHEVEALERAQDAICEAMEA